MIQFKISQFGKNTIRYSFTEAIKIMRDRGLMSGANGILHIHCSNMNEAKYVLSHKLYKEKCMMVYSQYDGNELIHCAGNWYDYDDFQSDELLDDFFESVQYIRNKKINEIMKTNGCPAQ